MCSGDHTLCGQGLRSLHDGHQIVGSNGPSIAVLSPIWTWCLCRYQMVLEVAAWPLLCAKGRGGSSIGLTRPSILFPFFLFGLRVGCERFHVVVLLRGGVEKKRREGQTVSSQRPCHVSHSSQRNRWTPLAFPKTASTSVLSQLRHVPCPSWHLHHNSTLLFPRHGMKCSLHIPPPIFLPSRQARKGPPLPVFPWLHDGCFAAPSSPSPPSPSPRLPLQLSTDPRRWDFHPSWGDGPWLDTVTDTAQWLPAFPSWRVDECSTCTAETSLSCTPGTLRHRRRVPWAMSGLLAPRRLVHYLRLDDFARRYALC